ncbi:MAG TPA: hypothetical protein VM677_17595 [Actinokineospora sp.]|jgi:hypothetical protein|nr:hypothetical protein [Actinokineospora sp.]
MAKVKTAAWTMAADPDPRSSRRRAWVPVTGLVMAFVLGFAAAFLISAVTAGPNSTDRRIAEFQQEEKDRDKAQTVVLSDLAKGGRDRITPVLTGMAAVVPVGKEPLRAPTADEVKGWREVLTAEVERHKDSPSAGNGVNVTRVALRSAVGQLAAAVDTFDIAVGVAEPDKARLLRLAGEQRTLAMRTWSAAAIQLDVINIEAGHGHVHAYLTEDPGSSPGDGVPEGTGRR